MTRVLVLALATGLLASGWSAGFFWTWSFTVMPGLGATPPEAAITAMRVINANIRTMGFAFVFFGPAAFAALAAVLAAAAGKPGGAAAAGLAVLTYAGGVLGVTFAANLPLNDALAAATVTPDGAATVWRGYAEPWTAWNHLRTVAASAAFLLMGAAAVLLAHD